MLQKKNRLKSNTLRMNRIRQKIERNYLTNNWILFLLFNRNNFLDSTLYFRHFVEFEFDIFREPTSTSRNTVEVTRQNHISKVTREPNCQWLFWINDGRGRTHSPYVTIRLLNKIFQQKYKVKLNGIDTEIVNLFNELIYSMHQGNVCFNEKRN